jgi:phosphoribosylformylglycinamidine (FGAM) synthase-like enzyme
MTALTPPPVPTRQAEDAANLINRTLGAHRTAVANLPAQTAPRRLAPPSDDREQIQAQATLLRVLSITEAFCAQRLLDQVEHSVDPAAAHSTLAGLWEAAAVDATRTWSDQQRGYRRWLGVEPDWKPVERLAEARNAVAHGLGRLTRHQLRRQASVRERLRLAGIPLTGDTLDLTDAVLARAADTCRTFIETIDLEVQQRPARYR